jgi:hypothetical protein
LDTKIKSIHKYPERRWITTWNYYLQRIKLFLRWLYNIRSKEADNCKRDDDIADTSSWETPSFAKIREKRSKRLSAYSDRDMGT